MDVGRSDVALLELPTEQPKKIPAVWSSSRLCGGEAMQPLMERVALLKKKGLTGQMVVAEFLRQSVVPLQEHSRPMLTLTNLVDDIQLSSCGLNGMAVDEATFRSELDGIFARAAAAAPAN